jgi:hypothetical protein
MARPEQFDVDTVEDLQHHSTKHLVE